MVATKNEKVYFVSTSATSAQNLNEQTTTRVISSLEAKQSTPIRQYVARPGHLESPQPLPLRQQALRCEIGLNYL